jgi:hypothetical protein
VRYSDAPYIALHHLERIEPIAVRKRVSKAARSPKGFLTAYKIAGGDPYAMGRDGYSGQLWEDRRSRFISRHMAQANRTNEKLWRNGHPSRRHLSLMMWGYTPTPDKTMDWLRGLRR